MIACELKESCKNLEKSYLDYFKENPITEEEKIQLLRINSGRIPHTSIFGLRLLRKIEMEKR